MGTATGRCLAAPLTPPAARLPPPPRRRLPRIAAHRPAHAANLRPRLVLAPCSSAIDWNNPDQQYSGQLFGLQRGSVLDPRGVRLVPANQHPQFGAVSALPGAPAMPAVPASRCRPAASACGLHAGWACPPGTQQWEACAVDATCPLYARFTVAPCWFCSQQAVEQAPSATATPGLQVCVDACTTSTCLQGLPDNDSVAAAATAFFCWCDHAPVATRMACPGQEPSREARPPGLLARRSASRACRGRSASPVQRAPCLLLAPTRRPSNPPGQPCHCAPTTTPTHLPPHTPLQEGWRAAFLAARDTSVCTLAHLTEQMTEGGNPHLA